MSIITISKGSYWYGSEIAEELAGKLGYECVSREVLLDASKKFNIPEIELVKAIEDPPSFLEHLSLGKEKYIAYIRMAFMKSIEKDNVVYHGFAGHFFLRYIPNICKVRINAEMSLRIKKVAEKEGVSAMKAEKMIDKIDKARRKWCRHFYGIDATDADLYDMVFKVDNLNKKHVVDMIADAVQLPCFQVSPRAQEAMKDRSLTFEIEARLLEKFPSTRNVSAKNGAVTVMIEAAISEKEKLNDELNAVLKGIDGVKSVDLRFIH